MFRQMEKLMELLREYNMSNQSPYILGDADYYVDGGLYAPQIISKSYWFIKWLVENDKIDYRWMPKFEERSRWTIWIDVEWENRVLMCLAISKHPIEDLILYLK